MLLRKRSEVDFANTRYKLDVHRAVHRNTIYIVKPTRCTSVSHLFILEWHSTCFGRSFRPSSGVQDCTYSNRHLSNRYCCLLADCTYSQEFVKQILLSACWLYMQTGICQTDTAVCLLTVHTDRHLSNRYCCLLADCTYRQEFVKQILLYVQSSTPDDGRKDRPKHEQCHSKRNKFDTLVHLFGFTIEITRYIPILIIIW